MEKTPDKLSIICVDDNPAVAEALQIKLRRTSDFEWRGALNCADDLVTFSMKQCPHLVLLDVDMPGRDPFEALAELVEKCPQTRAVMFSGHVRRELVERAVDAGAWGYVSKNDGEDELLAILRRVASGEFALSPEAKRVFHT